MQLATQVKNQVKEATTIFFSPMKKPIFWALAIPISVGLAIHDLNSSKASDSSETPVDEVQERLNDHSLVPLPKLEEFDSSLRSER